MNNPYTNRLMIRNPDEFIGRRTEVEKILSRVGASTPQSISIIGERRIGKSSLLYLLSHPSNRKRHLANVSSYDFVFFDLHGMAGISVEEFLHLFVEEVCQATGIPRPGPEPNGYLTIRRLLPQLEAEGRKLVVLLDEFEAITRNANFDQAFFSFFRSIANRYDLAYVTSSTRELQELCYTEEIAVSPFFNIFTNLYLRAFSPEEARQLIDGPSNKAELPLGAHQEFVLDLAGYFPLFLQIACCAIFDQLARGLVTEEAYRLGRRQFVEEAKPHLRYIWQHLDFDSRKILKQVCGSSPPVTQFTHVEDNLRREGYLINLPGSRLRPFSSVLGELIPEFERDTEDHDKTWVKETSEKLPTSMHQRFTILGDIGSGAMSRVFLAHDHLVDQKVALKLLDSKLYSKPGMLLRPKREAALARELHHPNICPVFDLFEEENRFFIVMKYIEGTTLRDLLNQGDKFELDSLLNVARQILRGLGEAHNLLIHRDLKPQNIMLDRDHHVYLLDFGLACARAQEGVGPGGAAQVGTPGYMSPEQIGVRALDQRSDLYSFGVVLFEMAIGSPPFTASSAHQLLLLHSFEVPPRPSSFRQELPAEFDEVVSSLLAKNPEERPPSATAVLAMLDRIIPERQAPR